MDRMLEDGGGGGGGIGGWRRGGGIGRCGFGWRLKIAEAALGCGCSRRTYNDGISISVVKAEGYYHNVGISVSKVSKRGCFQCKERMLAEMARG
jgi:hypothetical protein